ncbi:MAG: GNAT family N-acetyltransferase [Candidatus Thorarchaeota archaeon]|nr:GNAT family N-acetyltransferase [Candidatus Thorarchaeota archaeon]
MVDIVHRRWEDLDITSLAYLTRSVYKSEGNGDYTLEQVERYLRNMNERFPLDAIFLAVKEGTMVGWTGVQRKTESIGELGRWYPFVSDTPDRNEIAKLLISEVMGYAIENGMKRLEISFEISDENIQAYNLRCSWFGSFNWDLVEDSYYMNKDTSKKIPTANIPEGFHLHPLLEIDDDTLYKCHYAAFTNSEAREFYDLTEVEKRQHFDKLYDRFQSINSKASVVLKHGDEIASMLLVVSRDDEEHIAIVAVHPDYRGQGLAKAVLTIGIQEVRKQGMNNISIGVDVVNTPAVQLYTKFGFKIVSRLSFHSWKAT